MMTVREVAPPEGIPSSSVHSSNVDPQKAKIARRRRLELKKLKSSCHDNDHNESTLTRINDDVMSTTSDKGDKVTCASHGVVSMMGRRREMEDAVRVERGFVEVGSTKYDFFGVYDGHGGSHVAEACRDRMHNMIAEEVGDTWRKVGGVGESVGWEGVMERCFERMDREVGGGDGVMVEEVEEMTVGSTVVAAVVGREEIVVANCGDSRAVLCRGGVALPLSIDHKPDRPDELARIETAGGRVINWNGHRVLGVLATSRAIGDHYLKPYVSSIPEVTISKRTEADEFLILASDGLWDVMSNEVVCNVVRRCLTGKIQRNAPEIANAICKMSSSRAEVAAALLAELAIAKGSKDNISVIVVELRKFSRFICS